jgi:hypothetical protein
MATSLHRAAMIKRTILALAALVALAAPAAAQDALMPQVHPYALTAADAAAINARRPADWIPYRVTAGDLFAIDGYGLIHIPTMGPADPSVGIEAAFIEDLEPRATVR